MSDLKRIPPREGSPTDVLAQLADLTDGLPFHEMDDDAAVVERAIRFARHHQGAVSTIETHLHEPPRAPKGVRQADFRRGWEAARQAALIALGSADREYPE